MCVCARLTQPLASQFHPDANGVQRKEHSIDEVIKYRFVNYGIPSALFRIRAHSQSLAAVVGSARNVFIFIAIQFAFLLFPIHFGWMGNSHTTNIFFFRLIRRLFFSFFCCCYNNYKYISIQFHICTGCWLADVLIGALRFSIRRPISPNLLPIVILYWLNHSCACGVAVATTAAPTTAPPNSIIVFSSLN